MVWCGEVWYSIQSECWGLIRTDKTVTNLELDRNIGLVFGSKNLSTISSKTQNTVRKQKYHEKML